MWHSFIHLRLQVIDWNALLANYAYDTETYGVYLVVVVTFFSTDFKWMNLGSTSVLEYVVANISYHYCWERSNIEKAINEKFVMRQAEKTYRVPTHNS